MPSVEQIPGDLFDAPSGSVLLHSCNCQGVMGLALKERCPKSFEQYADHCAEHTAAELLGTAFVCDEENGYRIACLFTSAKYGKAKDSPAKILKATEAAIDDLIAQVNEDPDLKVPWEETKSLLEQKFSQHGLELTVYDK